MRAVIMPGTGTAFPDRLEDKDEYDRAVINIFKSMGYDPRSFYDAEGKNLPIKLVETRDVELLFEGVPKDIANEEIKHLVMVGYTSEGQAHFVVCSINRHDLHLRIRDDLFEKLRRACAEICDRSWRAHAKNPNDPHLDINNTIEIIEHGHSHATIRGDIVQKPLKTVIYENVAETLIIFITFIFSVLLFLFAPKIAENIYDAMKPTELFTKQYVQGFIERVDSALLVTFAIALINISLKYIQLRKTKPIKWNARIEPTSVTK